MNGNRIKEVKARQVLDSKRRPVVETEIYTENGKMGRAGASTGTSVGKNESYVLRDNDKELFGGLDAFRAVKNIEEIIGPALVSMDVTGQQAVNYGMIKLDGIRYKTNLGGNVICSVSCAAAKVAAANVGELLRKHLAEGEPKRVFVSAYNMINSGTYGDYTLVFQEFIVISKNISTFHGGPRIEVEILQKVGDIIKKYNSGEPPVVGSYSGYDAPSDDPFVLFDIFTEAASPLGYEGRIIFSMNCVTSEIYDEVKDAYLYKGTYVGRDEMISLFSRIAHKYPIGFVEDVLQEEDFEGFKKTREEIQAVLIGDDFICSSIGRTKRATDVDTIQEMILKPNRIGTLAEVTEIVCLMKQRDLLVVVPERTEGIVDDPNAELAIALDLPIVKTGASRSGGRIIFTSTGLRVEEQLRPGKTMADVLEVPGLEWLG